MITCEGCKVACCGWLVDWLNCSYVTCRIFLFRSSTSVTWENTSIIGAILEDHVKSISALEAVAKHADSRNAWKRAWVSMVIEIVFDYFGSLIDWLIDWSSDRLYVKGLVDWLIGQSGTVVMTPLRSFLSQPSDLAGRQKCSRQVTLMSKHSGEVSVKSAEEQFNRRCPTAVSYFIKASTKSVFRPS